ncbi:MAG: FAD-binding oxidoreductase, partial [Acidimicrobiales bacterium]
MPAMRRFWGWGYEGAGLSRAEQVKLERRVQPLLGERAFAPIEPPGPDEVALGRSRVAPPAPLAAWCRVDDLTLAGHTYGKSYRDVVRALERR